jgi:hypothetical protein
MPGPMKKKERATKPVNMTLRRATIAAVKAAAAAQYATVSRYVDGVLTEHLARKETS